MAGPLALALVLGLASLSFVMRATGSFLPSVPSAVTERMAGLAPLRFDYWRDGLRPYLRDVLQSHRR